jgi:UPF0755 protein
MSDDRPIEPDESAGPVPEPDREPDHARESGDGEPRPRRSARHARSQGRPARPARPARAPHAERAPGASGPTHVRTGLPTGASAVRRRLTVAFVVLALLAGGIAFGVWSTLYRVAARVPAGRSVTVTVAKGSSSEAVATMLAEAGIVDNAMMFRWRASQLGATGRLKAGTYTLKTGSAYDDVIRILEHGPVIESITVTIPEGYDIRRTAARIEQKLGIPAEQFADLATTGAKEFDFAFLADNPTRTLEGYLFPKTYSFKPSVTATDVIRTMLAQYGKETAALDYAYAKSKKLDPHEVLTIASLVEREASIAGERPKVAAVAYNRLRIGMPLQFCSTVQYVLGGKEKLTNGDLKTPSPYNTYLHAGLPPGPICSPGSQSIQAALAPTKAGYLYFVLTGKDGSQSFTSSYPAFLRLKAQAEGGLK